VTFDGRSEGLGGQLRESRFSEKGGYWGGNRERCLGAIKEKKKLKSKRAMILVLTNDKGGPNETFCKVSRPTDTVRKRALNGNVWAKKGKGGNRGYALLGIHGGIHFGKKSKNWALYEHRRNCLKMGSANLAEKVGFRNNRLDDGQTSGRSWNDSRGPRENAF